MARLRVAAVGEVGVDLYEADQQRYLGGCSANFARGAARAGAQAFLFAAVGDDDRAAEIRYALADTQLELRVRDEHGASALQPIQIEPSGERVLAGWTPGVVARYELTAQELVELRTMDVIAIADTPAAAQCLKIDGPHRVADFSQDAQTPWQFDGLAIAFVGGTPADLDRLRPHPRPGLVVLTAGAAGAWALDGDRVIHQPTLATRVVDTTGCGDAFQAAFTVAIFTGATIEEALAAGAAAAAACAARRGA